MARYEHFERLKAFQAEQGRQKDHNPELLRAAIRTAFVSRFIVLREGRRSRAHRVIELIEWTDEHTAEDLYNIFREAFIENGDKLQPVDRDLKRALEHAHTSAPFFMDKYSERVSLSFRDALDDYERSNRLLFGDDPEDVPRNGGWRLTAEL